MEKYQPKHREGQNYLSTSILVSTIKKKKHLSKLNEFLNSNLRERKIVQTVKNKESKKNIMS